MKAARHNLVRHLTIGLTPLTVSEKRRGWILLLFVVVGSAFDLYAIAALVPLFGLIAAPAVWSSKPLVHSALEFVGVSDLQTIIPVFTVIVAGQLIVASINNVLLRHLINKFGMDCAARFAGDLASSATQAPLTWFLERNPAVVARQINNDAMRWGSNFLAKAFSVMQTATLASLAVVAILMLAPLAGAIAVLIAFVFSVLSRLLTRKRLNRYAHAELKKTDSAAVYILQLLSGIKDIKLSSNPQFFVKRFHEAFSSIALINTRRGTIQQVVPVVLLILGQLSLISVVFFMWFLGEPASRIAEQALLLGLVASRLVPAINRVFADLAYIWDSFPYISGLLSLEATLCRNSGASQQPLNVNSVGHIVTFEKVSYNYSEAPEPALTDVTCRILTGHSYGVAGSSGSGKTTFIDLFLGLLFPTAGTIAIGEQQLDQIRLPTWHEKIGYVSQHPFVTDDTLRANIAFGSDPEDIDDRRVMECLRQSGLVGIESLLPNGLDTFLGDRGVRLSGGQRQRIAIARALYKKPEIIIFDEATSSLDMISESEILDTVRSLHGRVTMLIVAHRLATIQWCDEVFFFANGALVDRGTFDALQERNSEFSEMVSLSSLSQPSLRDPSRDLQR
jgi:ABC-type multidrug transport system fused ATPase/permease subunit